MKCPVCQQEVRDDAHFCTVCGAKMEPAPAPQPVPDIIPEPVAAVEPEVVAAPVAVEEPAPQPQYEYVPQAPVYQPAPQSAYQSVQQPAHQSTYQASNRPVYQLPETRGLLKMIFLGLITGGIYNMVVMSRIAEEINMVASKYDGKRTQQFMWVSVLAGLTMGIYAFVWIHGLCNRIGGELKRRDINYKFNASTFWLWNILGSLLFGIGPLVYTYKFCKATNLMNKDHNLNG